MCSRRLRWRASASPSRCSSPTWPSRTRCSGTRRRSACSPPRCSRPRSAGCCSGSPGPTTTRTVGAPARLDPPVDRAHDHIRGPLDAPLSLVEYGDAECPFCGDATGASRRRAMLRRRYGDRLRLRLPPPAAGGRPPPRPPRRRGHGGGGSTGTLLGDARPVVRTSRTGWSSTTSSGTRRRSAWTQSGSWRRCATTCTRRRIDADVDSAERSGVTGTPTFFVNGERVKGPHTAEALAEALDRVVP